MIKESLTKYFVLFIALCGVSCTGYNKLLKSDDQELKYRKAIEFYEKGKYSKTANLLETVNQFFAGTDKADSLGYYYGASLYKQGDFATSGEIFDAFRRTYSHSPFIEDAEYMYAKGLYFSAPDYKRDQTNNHKAIMAIGEYLSRYPNSAKKQSLEENVADLQQRLYDKSMENAKLYYDIGYYNSAIVSLKNAIALYPESNHRELMSYLIVRSYYVYAKNSVQAKQRQRYMDMQDAYYSFVAEYPESTYKKDVDKMQEDAKKFLARFAEKEAAGKAPEEKKSRKLDRPAPEMKEEKIPELKFQQVDHNNDKIINTKRVKQKTESTIENSNIENGNQKK